MYAVFSPRNCTCGCTMVMVSEGYAGTIYTHSCYNRSHIHAIYTIIKEELVMGSPRQQSISTLRRET